MIIPSRRGRFTLAVALAAALGGIAAAIHYARLDLTLSHYDARGHLIVARRIVDSLTPGWRQIGAIWLPLPHLLNAVPVQSDLFYRTGASAVALSILSFGLATAAVAWIVATITGSLWAAAAGAAVFALNPNVLYLQATPMTEPMLIALTTIGVALLMAWCGSAPDLKVGPTWPRLIGVVFALACLTRYEAWPITPVALVAAVWARRRNGSAGLSCLRSRSLHPSSSELRRSAESQESAAPRWPVALREVAAIAIYPAASVLGFMLFSRIVIGRWFVASGFFVPDNPALGRPFVAAGQVVAGVGTLGGAWLTPIAVLGVIALVTIGILDRRRTAAVVPLSLVAAAALPWLAFLQGHPHRIRYMVPLLAAQAVFAGVAVGIARRAAPLVALVLVLLMTIDSGPLDANAPMVVEAQWDRSNSLGRRKVTSCLAAEYDRTAIMASMGSLGHYMQELAGAGFSVRDFLHEGNGEVWSTALRGARPFVGWVMIEEHAEGGDMLAALAHEDAGLLDGFSRVCEGGGVALYRRAP